MPEHLAISVPEMPNPNLQFVQAKIGPIAIASCVEWDIKATTTVRSEFDTYLTERVKLLKNRPTDKPVELNELYTAASAFVVGMNNVYRSKEDVPEGLIGFSLAMAHDGSTKEVPVPHALIANHPGTTGVFVPGEVNDASGPRGAFIRHDNGLFSTPRNIEASGFGPADVHTVLFNREPVALYLGPIWALKAINSAEQIAPSSPNYGSILWVA